MQLMMHSRMAEQQEAAHSKDLLCAALAATQPAIAPAATAATADSAGVAELAAEAPAGAANAAGLDFTADQPSPQSLADELLAYALGWFSMVAPLLGLSLLAAS
jgi:hypothetical protein